MYNWEQLEHAYGRASNIPALLEQIATYPSESACDNEPWFTLWSSLCHQGDVYSASFAAVPDIVKYLKSSPDKATVSYFALPAAIEVARVKNGNEIPEMLAEAYFSAIKNLGVVAGELAGMEVDEDIAQGAIAAFAVAVGQHEYADFVLNVPISELSEVMEWYWQR